MRSIALATFVVILTAWGPGAGEASSARLDTHLASLLTPVEDQISVHFPSTSGAPLPYGEYIPPGYNSSTELHPVVIHLNGIGELGVAGNTSALYDVVTRNGALKNIRNSATWKAYHGAKKALIFVPQAVDNYSPTEIRPFVQFIVANYRVDPKRVYLTGLSMGGWGAWRYATLYGTELAALATFATNIGAPGDTIPALKEVPVWVGSTHGDRWGEQSWVLPVTKNYNHWAFPPLVASSQTTTYLFNRTAPGWTSQPGFVTTGHSIVRYVLYPGNAHTGWGETYGQQSFWDWLFAQQRQ
ncbi:phospholipase [Myxococcus sp. MISCRS1]|uniref:carboxylesterase family protein n=1 Tax=Myxococcus sp. MISCRS1 TaxID=2996786 RepID=UPI00226D5A66|nr:PHB depolymerase family esterase [Myxococcus sp. MISCRS1]MCY0996610.1 phospholipase [Myxococcus sp. MISCRS1]